MAFPALLLPIALVDFVILLWTKVGQSIWENIFSLCYVVFFLDKIFVYVVSYHCGNWTWFRKFLQSYVSNTQIPCNASTVMFRIASCCRIEYVMISRVCMYTLVYNVLITYNTWTVITIQIPNLSIMSTLHRNYLNTPTFVLHYPKLGKLPVSSSFALPSLSFFFFQQAWPRNSTFLFHSFKENISLRKLFNMSI